MRLKLLVLCLPLFAAMPVGAAERRGDQGVGVMVGNPSGVSYKMWLGESVAFDAAAGIARSEFDVHATLLWHNFSWSHNLRDSSGFFSRINGRGDLPFYFGFGPRVLFEDKEEVGLRFPVGLSFLPHNSLWEFFGEFAPVLRLTPDAGFNGDFAVGVRYYFPAIRPRG